MSNGGGASECPHVTAHTPPARELTDTPTHTPGLEYELPALQLPRKATGILPQISRTPKHQQGNEGAWRKRSGRGRGKKGSSCSGKEQEVPASLHILLGPQMWPSAEPAENVPARERPRSARGRSRSLGLQRQPRFFQEALPEPPGSSGNCSTRPRSPSSRARRPGGTGCRRGAGRAPQLPGPYLGTLGLITAAPLGAAGAAGAAAAVPSFQVPFSNVIL